MVMGSAMAVFLSGKSFSLAGRGLFIAVSASIVGSGIAAFAVTGSGAIADFGAIGVSEGIGVSEDTEALKGTAVSDGKSSPYTIIR